MSSRRPTVESGEISNGPWPLPTSWSWRRLGHVANLIRGVSYNKSQVSTEINEINGRVPLLRGGNIQNGRVVLDDLVFVETACVAQEQYLQTNDIVCTMSSGSAHLVGKTALFSVGESTTFGAFCATIRCTNDLAKWVFLFSQTNAYRELLTRSAKGTNINNLKREHINDVLLPVPPANLRQEVVKRVEDLLGEIDDGETALAQARADLEVYRRSLLKAAVTGELTADWRAANPPKETGADLLARILADRRVRWGANPKNAGRKYKEPSPPNAQDLSVLPYGWVWASLEQLAFVSGGITVDAKRSPHDPRIVPYLRVANVQRGWLDLSNLKYISIEASALESLKIRNGDMLLNEGGDRDKVGRGWIFEGQIDSCVHQNHIFKARPMSDLIVPQFIMRYLNEFGRRFFFEQGKQTTNLASISMTKVTGVPVPVPPKDETDAILSLLQEADFDDGPNKLALADLDQIAGSLRQSILAAAFRGDLL